MSSAIKRRSVLFPLPASPRTISYFATAIQFSSVTRVLSRRGGSSMCAIGAGDPDVGDHPADLGTRLLGVSEPRKEALDPDADAVAVVVDDRDLPLRVIVLVPGRHPVDTVIVPERFPRRVAALVHQVGLVEEEGLHLVKPGLDSGGCLGQLLITSR